MTISLALPFSDGMVLQRELPVRIWRKATPSDLERFSAIGCYFARELEAELDVPEWLVSCQPREQRGHPGAPVRDELLAACASRAGIPEAASRKP